MKKQREKEALPFWVQLSDEDLIGCYAFSLSLSLSLSLTTASILISTATSSSL
jgi:hypothetical protein